MLNRILFIGLTVALVSICAIHPVHAACGGNPLISTISSSTDVSFIWTQGQFEPHYYAGYVWDTAPPVTEDFHIDFWALGSGDPVIGNGNDNGAFDVTAAGFYYLSDTQYGTTYFYAGELFTGWGVSSLIDGCLYNSGASTGFDGDECTVVLMEDRVDDTGYFLLASSLAEPTGACFFVQPGNAPLILKPLPDPVVQEATGPLSTLVYLEIEMPQEVDGLYFEEGCESDLRFKVYAQLMDPGSPAPADRDRSQWVALTADAIPISEPINLSVSCLTGQEFVIATSLFFDSGYESAYVSSNSERFVCGCPTDPGGSGFGFDCFTCVDLDGDGYGSPGDPTCPAGETEDCGDDNALVFPGAVELYDALDNDCDGAIDEELDDDGDGIPNFYDLCNETPRGSGVGPNGCAICGPDEDSDGFPSDTDCDDTDPAVHPNAVELPGNTVDENCDGVLSCDPSLAWRNHGQFTRCVAHACRELVAGGVISSQACAEIISRSSRGSSRP